MSAPIRERGILSRFDRSSSATGGSVRAVQLLVFLGLIISCVGPLLLMVKMAISPTQETIRNPFAWFPSGQVLWGNLGTAWDLLDIQRYLLNTVVQTGGATVLAVVVATTGAYALSILRPWFSPVVNGLVLATLFIPGVVTLIPAYLTVLDVPLVHWNLLNTPMAIWLPAAANAFNVIIVKRFFDTVPREYLEAARIDGAGPFATFWIIVLPLSRPIIGVVALLTFMNSWKDYLWPLLVESAPGSQPLSVAIPAVTKRTELSITMAALLIAALIPILLFLLFQRSILRGVSMASGIKG